MVRAPPLRRLAVCPQPCTCAQCLLISWRSWVCVCGGVQTILGADPKKPKKTGGMFSKIMDGMVAVSPPSS